MMDRVKKVLLLGILGGVAACSGESPEGSAAIENWMVSERPLIQIGEREGSSEYLFQSISAIRLLEDGSIAVADEGPNTLRIFQADGTFVREFGGTGEGPGEFTALNDIEPLAGDTLALWDRSLQRMTLYRTDGSLLSTMSMRAPDGSPETLLGRYRNGDWALQWIVAAELDQDRSDPDADPMAVGRFAADGSFRDLVATADGLVRQGNGPVPFSPELHAVVIHDSLFMTDGQDPAVRVLGDGGQVARTLEVELPTYTSQEARRMFTEVLSEQGTRERLDRFQIPEAAWDWPVPHIADVLVDDQDQLWLKAYDPRMDGAFGRVAGVRSTGGRWLVVEPEGSVVAEVRLPKGFIPSEVRDGRVAGIGVDSLGVERIEVYDLKR